jgi:hypothetical protein
LESKFIMQTRPSPQQLLDIITHGVFYAPASKHYPDMLHGHAKVSCDDCGARDLTACIGHGSFDLCLFCAQVHSRLLAVKTEVPHRGVTPLPSTQTPPATSFTLDNLVGMTSTAAAERLRAMGKDLRAYEENTTVFTCDYCPNRLNAIIDDHGIIVRLAGWG